MTYQLIYRVDLGNAQSPFRIVAQPAGREVGWINRFLDQCCVRGLAWHTLRGYAFDLTHFVRKCGSRIALTQIGSRTHEKMPATAQVASQVHRFTLLMGA